MTTLTGSSSATDFAGAGASAGVSWVPGQGFVATAAPSSSSTPAIPAPGTQYAGPYVDWAKVVGAAPANSVFPNPIPAANVARPVITPAGLGTPGSTPIAQGYDIFQGMLDNILQAERLRQSAVDQTVNIAQLFAQLNRASPTQAADLATSLGLPGLEPDLSFANRFTNSNTMGSFGGTVGTQAIKLPFAFSGKELTFLGNNPTTSAALQDIAARFGRPDILNNSLEALIPGNKSLFTL